MESGLVGRIGVVVGIIRATVTPVANGFHAEVQISVFVSSPIVYDSKIISRIPTQLPGEFLYAVEFSRASGEGNVRYFIAGYRYLC